MSELASAWYTKLVAGDEGEVGNVPMSLGGSGVLSYFT